jgi:luciferase family oxidoreductase group 1
MSRLPSIPVSVLDTAPVQRSAAAADALAATVELARRADDAGFTRFWVTEHHNSASIASSSPAVLLAAIGAATGRIRIGSGGVMLPNHPPLIVAEAFRTLGALFPDRVDLGIGRAPGTDPATAEALRRVPVERFDQELDELLHFLGGTFPAEHPYHGIQAVPAIEIPPTVWLLGSSGQSALVAAKLGLPYAFAHNFFSSRGVVAALNSYRENFRPGPLERPHSMVVVHVVCGEDDEHARWLSDPAVFQALPGGGVTRPEPLLSQQEVAAHAWTADERSRAEALFAEQAVGGPDRVRLRLADLLERTGADELMVTNNLTDPRHKNDSLARVRHLFGDRLPTGVV